MMISAAAATTMNDSTLFDDFARSRSDVSASAPIRGVEQEEVRRDQQARDTHEHHGHEQVVRPHDSDRGNNKQREQEDAENNDHFGSSRSCCVSANGRLPASNAALASA
jgi:hypothetical protein